MSRSKDPILLTKQELVLMKAIWDRHPDSLTVRQVAESINSSRKKSLAYTTIQTLLNILTEKKALARVRERAHKYRALVSREEVSTSMVGDLVERIYDGRIQPLLIHLVGNESLGKEDLRELREWIDDHLGDEENV